jgi:cyanophycin synthetase
MSRGKTRQVDGQPGRYNVIFGFGDERVGLAAAKLAVRLVNHLVRPTRDFDFAAELEAFLLQAPAHRVRPVDPGHPRRGRLPGHPVDPAERVLAGAARPGVHQKRIRATMTSQTSALAVDIASDKELTTRLLAAAGLPVPRSEAVRSADRAVRIAGRIGYPWWSSRWTATTAGASAST